VRIVCSCTPPWKYLQKIWKYHQKSGDSEMVGILLGSSPDLAQNTQLQQNGAS
jgi:hypothetical protein